MLRKRLFTVIAGSILISCSTTSIISSWKAPGSTQLTSFKKTIVIALPGEKFNSTRAIMESQMAVSLKARGVNAISSFDLYGPQAIRGLGEKEVLDKFAKDGTDAAITIVLMDRKKESYYTPGGVTYMPYYYNFWGYYSTMYDRVYVPGYYTTTIDYILETNVYRLREEALIYSVQTRTNDPANAQTMASEVSTTVIRDMINKGIIPLKEN